MKVLVVGSGGREHALIWKIQQSPKVKEIFCAPGNGGIAEFAECVPIAANDISELIKFVEERSVDLTIVGPEDPLNDGIVDAFREKELRIFGPTGKAAAIEGSKAFAKELMKKYNIPTAGFEVFSDPDKALSYLQENPAPIVIKASGLAAGKGAIVCLTDEEAENAVKKILVDKAFGDAGESIVIEEFMSGEELSVFVLTDGKDFLTLPSSQDHKPIYNGDKGPNTGGMGAYAPAPLASEELMREINDKIIQPTIDAMRNEGIPYTGLLYGGLMITDKGPKVVEFNCRFGDPETQVVLPLVEGDLIEFMEATIDGTIGEKSLIPSDQYAVCVILASGGYPGSYEKEKEIFGLDEILPGKRKIVFHAGTKLSEGKIVTNGGRVLCVTGLNEDLRQAVEIAYKLAESVHFEKVYYRTDIAGKGLSRLYGG